MPASRGLAAKASHASRRRRIPLQSSELLVEVGRKLCTQHFCSHRMGSSSSHTYVNTQIYIYICLHIYFTYSGGACTLQMPAIGAAGCKVCVDCWSQLRFAFAFNCKNSAPELCRVYDHMQPTVPILLSTCSVIATGCVMTTYVLFHCMQLLK